MNTIDGLKLYEINEVLRETLDQINEIAETNEGEIPDLWSNLLDGIQLSKEKKVLDIARYIKSLKLQAIAINSEIDKLNTRYRACNRHIERLTEYLKTNINPDEKYKDNNTVISWRKSERIRIINENLIPSNYLKTEVSIMKSFIKKDMKNGIEIEGVELELIQNIQIK